MRRDVERLSQRLKMGCADSAGKGNQYMGFGPERIGVRFGKAGDQAALGAPQIGKNPVEQLP